MCLKGDVSLNVLCKVCCLCPPDLELIELFLDDCKGVDRLLRSRFFTLLAV